MKNLIIFLLVFTFLSMYSCTKKDEGEVEKASNKTGIITVNGIEFSFFIEGSGTPCMVVGDALTPSKTLSKQLKEHFKFIFLNSRMTTRPEIVGDVSRVTMDTLVADIEKARLALNLDSVCVLAHSISGILALEYARKYPQSVTHVIMHGTPPYFNQQFKEEVAAYWDRNASKERKIILEERWAVIGDDSLNNLSPSDADILGYVTDAPKYFHNPNYNPTWLFEDAYWNRAGWNQLLNVIMKDYDLEADKVAGTPVFLAIGRDDYAVPYTLWEKEKDKIANLSYNLFEQSGHYPMLEEQKLFDQKLLAWINERI